MEMARVMSVALSTRDYGFTYSIGSTPALSGVSLDLAGGQVVSVVSGQGAGKTTLLRAAAGLLGEIYHGAVTGSIEYGSRAHRGASTAVTSDALPGARGSTAAFFDGYVQVTLAVETVREELSLPLIAAGVDRASRDARAEAITRELVIDHLLDRRVTELSGGEEKLVGIAAALIPDVPIHILDEPFEQLDVSHMVAVIRAAKRRARAGRLLLIATGSADIALNIADSAVMLIDGAWRVVESPTYADAARVAGLGLSPVMDFLSSHHSPGADVRRFRDAVRCAS
jgi:energy-coupling factor transporter ATP-binding protein EcfA2